MRQIGKVQVPQSAFMAVLKLDYQFIRILQATMAVSSEDRLAPCNPSPSKRKCNSLTIIEIMKEEYEIWLTLFNDLPHYQHFPFYARCPS